jgi:flagellar hook-length control protein FliK
LQPKAQETVPSRRDRLADKSADRSEDGRNESLRDDAAAERASGSDPTTPTPVDNASHARNDEDQPSQSGESGAANDGGGSSIPREQAATDGSGADQDKQVKQTGGKSKFRNEAGAVGAEPVDSISPGSSAKEATVGHGSERKTEVDELAEPFGTTGKETEADADAGGAAGLSDAALDLHLATASSKEADDAKPTRGTSLANSSVKDGSSSKDAQDGQALTGAATQQAAGSVDDEVPASAVSSTVAGQVVQGAVTTHEGPDEERREGRRPRTTSAVDDPAGKPGDSTAPAVGTLPEVDTADALAAGSSHEAAASTPDTVPGTEQTADSLGNPTRSEARHSYGIKPADEAASPGRSSLGPAEASRFVSRVARAVDLAHQRGEMLQIRLSPPELGSLRIEIAVRGGILTAQLETDSAAARSALLDNLPVLRDRLAEQNVRVERFEVNVRDESGGTSHERAPSFDDQRRRAPEGPHHRQSVVSETEQPGPRAVPLSRGRGQLNLVA